MLQDSLTDVYRNSDLFRTLRDTTQREGKCGICEYQKICGGSRSRAYALTGDYLAEDPRCIYQPHLAEAGGLKSFSRLPVLLPLCRPCGRHRVFLRAARQPPGV